MPPPGSRGLPGTSPISSHFTHSPYVTGILPAVALVLNPRVGGFAYILRPCGPFKQSVLKIQQLFPLPQPPLVFIARSYGDLSSQYGNPRLCGLAWGWDHSLPTYPSQFLSPTCECGTTHSCSTTATTSLCHTASPHLSATHLCFSTPPTCLDACGFFKSLLSDFHTVQFSHSSGCYLF